MADRSSPPPQRRGSPAVDYAQGAVEADLDKRRCRCCVTEAQARGTVFVLFGLALMAYTIYSIVQCALSRARPSTATETRGVDVINTPGVVVCPLDPRHYPGLSNPQYLLTNTSGTPFSCQLFKENGQVLPCPFRFIDFQFRAVSVLPRTCLDIPPGVALNGIRDFVYVQYAVAQNCTAAGTAATSCNNIDGVFYGLYAEDTDGSRNASLINLTGGGGRSVVQFVSTVYVPLSGPDRPSFTIASVSAAGLLPNGIVSEPLEGGGSLRVLPGAMVLVSNSMSVTYTTELWGFTPLQMIGAVGGVYSMLKGMVVFLQGFDQDEGLLRRWFYQRNATASTAAANASPYAAAGHALSSAPASVSASPVLSTAQAAAIN